MEAWNPATQSRSRLRSREEPESPLADYPNTEAERAAAALADADDALADGAEEEQPDDGRAWYIVQTYSGYENKVKTNLDQRVKSMDVQDRIFEVVIPTEDEIEIRDG